MAEVVSGMTAWMAGTSPAMTAGGDARWRVFHPPHPVAPFTEGERASKDEPSGAESGRGEDGAF
jgi:hypothetical protein